MNIQAQFRVFPDRLLDETSSLSLTEVEELDSKELIRRFCTDNTGNACNLCWLHKTESVAESMISKYNIYNNELRLISEETAQSEMFIAYNDPEKVTS
jgi:hypothetical protein